jgi:UDP-3-O-[3-hydroxymyristoyl] glucosamine N-acyltransferase
VHPTAEIASDAVLEDGTVVGPRAVVGARARLAACLVLADAIVPADTHCRGAVFDPALGRAVQAVP